MKLVALVICLISFAGCIKDYDGDGVIRVACVGASDTQAGIDNGASTLIHGTWSNPVNPPILRWCERAAAVRTTAQSLCNGVGCVLPTTWTNYAGGGATVTDPGSPFITWWGQPQIDAALADHADAVVIWLGLNDAHVYDSLPQGSPSAETVANGLVGYCNQVRAAGRQCWIITMPEPPDHPKLTELPAYNAALIPLVTAPWLIDGTTGMTFTADDLHTDCAGHVILGQRVLDAVW